MTDNKLTDEQVERAFEICYGIDKVVGCTSCPLYDEEDFCKRGDVPLEEQFFDVYKRKKAEIEKLNVDLVGMRGACESYKIHYDNAQAEIERLQNAYKQCAWERDTFLEELKTAKSEARKEFAERLKEMSEHFELEKENFVSEEDIENLLKEMEGE